MNDLHLEREIHDTLRRRVADVMDPQAVPPARPVLRRTRWRQLATVITVVTTAVVLVAMSFVGVEALLRTSEPGVPAAPPEVPGYPTVLRATVTWDGETCTYEGPRTLSADQMLAPSDRQRLLITIEDRPRSEIGFVVVARLQRRSSYAEFVEWAATHEANFYGSFPPRRFSIPGSGQIVGRQTLHINGLGWIGPFDEPGRYYLACGAGTLHPAALLQVTDGS